MIGDLPGNKSHTLLLAGVGLALVVGCKATGQQQTPPQKNEPISRVAAAKAAVPGASKGPGPTLPAGAGARLDPREIIKRNHKGVFLIAYRVHMGPPRARVIKEGALETTKKQTTPAKDRQAPGTPRKTAGARSGKKSAWILLCTAFALGKRTLATTGDCVHFVRMARRKKVDYFIAQNLGISRAFRVVKTHLHPEYCRNKEGLRYDLGAIVVDRDLGAVLPVASTAELDGIQEKDAVYYYGFPTEATPDLKAPTASMIGGKVVRLTDVEFFEKAPGARKVIVHHDALTSPGTSGSPIFSASGKVIGVQAGAHHFPLDLEAVAKTSIRNKRYSFGIRIDQFNRVVGKK